MTRYKQAYDGEWIRPADGYKFSCCDCGLVHKTEFRVAEDGKVEWRVWIDIRATAAKRRNKQ